MRDCLLDTADFAEDSCKGTNMQEHMLGVATELRVAARGIERTLVNVATPGECDRILGITPKANDNA